MSVFSNFEKKVAENIKELVEQKNLENEVSEVLVPTEEVLEIRRGKKVQRERRFMPGYVLVKMDMNEEVYHAIKSITKFKVLKNTKFSKQTLVYLVIKMIIK